ncbi:hypothetical protein CYMTET_17181 [Cymbomonas tetramitiformis]|uniref:Uncharacterized protein n=1 Tax=Cymbomonas tetramitiformis TaxID=36881 RepID=A0AAE0GAT3_9CHLO|nr:hypothetical protein CYMTET_17181 [Cymbomonas tetramitiformis]
MTGVRLGCPPRDTLPAPVGFVCHITTCTQTCRSALWRGFLHPSRPGDIPSSRFGRVLPLSKISRRSNLKPPILWQPHHPLLRCHPSNPPPPGRRWYQKWPRCSRRARTGLSSHGWGTPSALELSRNHPGRLSAASCKARWLVTLENHLLKAEWLWRH